LLIGTAKELDMDMDTKHKRGATAGTHARSMYLQAKALHVDGFLSELYPILITSILLRSQRR